MFKSSYPIAGTFLFLLRVKMRGCHKQLEVPHFHIPRIKHFHFSVSPQKPQSSNFVNFQTVWLPPPPFPRISYHIAHLSYPLSCQTVTYSFLFTSLNMRAAAWSHVFTDGSRFSRNSLDKEEAYPTEREQPGLRGIPCSRLLYIPLCFLPVSIITSLFYHRFLFTCFLFFPVTPLQSQFFILLIFYVATLYVASPCCRHFLHFVPAPCPLLPCQILTNNLLSFSCRHGDSYTAFLEILQAEYWKLVDMRTSIAPQEMKSLEKSKYL